VQLGAEAHNQSPQGSSQQSPVAESRSRREEGAVAQRRSGHAEEDQSLVATSLVGDEGERWCFAREQISARWVGPPSSGVANNRPNGSVLAHTQIVTD